MDEEALKRYHERVKRQNDKVKDNYDRISATLPKGTIDRIRAHGETVNSFINMAVLEALDVLEEDDAPQAPEIENTAVVEQVTIAPDKTTGNGASDSKKVDLNDLQAQFDALQAQQKKDQEQAARLYGEADKEAARALTISREERGY